MQDKKIGRSATGIGAATLGSRILGFARDVLIAKYFGTGIYAQVFIAAFRIPNLLRRLLGEGALNPSFVPVFTEEFVKKGKDEAWNLAISAFNILSAILVIVVLLGVIFSPTVTRLIVPGFRESPEKLALTSKLLSIMFPYLLFIGLASLMMAILNSLKHFSTPAIAPMVLNVAMILFLLFFIKSTGEPVVGLSIAVVIGGIGQFVLQLVVALKKGFPLGKRFVFYHPLVKRVALLMLPATIGVAVYHINIFVDQICGSYESIVGAGAIAALYYSNRLMQFPLSVFVIAMATAVFPFMAEAVSKNDTRAFRETVSFGLRTVFILAIPSAVGLMVLRKPIVSILFERHEFDAYSTEITSSALLYYCVGLFAYSGVHILSRAFYSLQDMVTPVKIGSIAMVINIALNIALMWPLKVGGLALATSISSMINFFFLGYFLRKRVGNFGEKKIMFSFLRVVGASLIMGLILACLTKLCTSHGSLAVRIVKLGASMLIGTGVFAGILVLLAPQELKLLKRLL